MKYQKFTYCVIGALACLSMSACSPTESQSAMTTQSVEINTATVSSPESASTAETPEATAETAAADSFTNENTESEGDRTAAWVPSGLRLGEHNNYVRLVLDLTDGEGQLGYHIARDAHPTEMGRGMEIKVPSNGAPLDIMVTGTTIPVSGKHYEAYESIPLEGNVAGVAYKFDGVFEGTTHLVIGTPNQKGYRVQQLDNPKRLVIDIAK